MLFFCLNRFSSFLVLILLLLHLEFSGCFPIFSPYFFSALCIWIAITARQDVFLSEYIQMLFLMTRFPFWIGPLGAELQVNKDDKEYRQ